MPTWPEQMRKVVERNRAEMAPGIGHSHDFGDANMILYEVFLQHGRDPATEDGMERHGHLWEQAWSLASRGISNRGLSRRPRRRALTCGATT